MRKLSSYVKLLSLSPPSYLGSCMCHSHNRVRICAEPSLHKSTNNQEYPPLLHPHCRCQIPACTRAVRDPYKIPHESISASLRTATAPSHPTHPSGQKASPTPSPEPRQTLQGSVNHDHGPWGGFLQPHAVCHLRWRERMMLPMKRVSFCFDTRSRIVFGSAMHVNFSDH